MSPDRDAAIARDRGPELTRRGLLGAATALACGAPAPAAERKTTHLPRARPQDIGLDPKRLQAAYDLMEEWTAGPNAPVPGGAVLVGRSGKALAPRFFGRQGPEADAAPIRPDAMFYLASVTKPVIYLAAM